jgi:hypothetical protein
LAKDKTDSYGSFLALAEAQPAAQVVVATARLLIDQQTSMLAKQFYAALCVAGTKDEILAQIEKHWGKGMRVGMHLLRPLAARITRDDATMNYLQASALQTQSHAYATAISVALAERQALNVELAEKLQALHLAELSGTATTGYTFDARTGTVRPIAAILAEIL